MRIAALVVIAASVVAAQDTPTQAVLEGRALIDKDVQAKLADQGLKAAAKSDDAEFLRRVCLDIVGSIPALDPADKFLHDKSPDRRTKLIDALLAHDGYAASWSWQWASALVGHGGDRPPDQAIVAVTEQLKPLFQKNASMAELARTIITYSGTYYFPGRGGKDRDKKDDKDKKGDPAKGGMMGGDEVDEGAAATDGMAIMYFRWQQTAGRDMAMALANKFSRQFLGMQISCAQCHDHPFDKWTQEDFYGMAAFFVGTNARQLRDGPGEPFYAAEVIERPARRTPQLQIPDTKKMVKAGWLETREAPAAGKSTRDEFARLLTDKKTTQFARAMVNRTWAHFFGRGIVNPPDDFNGRNKPTHPELLDGLAAQFAAHDYDQKWLIREICNSDAYQRTSRVKERTPDLEKYYAVSGVRALTPEQVMNSIITASLVDPSTVTSLQKIGILRDFRYSFGDDEDVAVMDFEGSIPSALLMMNGILTARATGSEVQGGRPMKRVKKGDPVTRLEQILESRKGDEERLRAVFITALSRQPSAKELARYGGHVRGRSENGYEDVLWALLNSSEFLFNH